MPGARGAATGRRLGGGRGRARRCARRVPAPPPRGRADRRPAPCRARPRGGGAPRRPRPPGRPDAARPHPRAPRAPPACSSRGDRRRRSDRRARRRAPRGIPGERGRRQRHAGHDTPLSVRVGRQGVELGGQLGHDEQVPRRMPSAVARSGSARKHDIARALPAVAVPEPHEVEPEIGRRDGVPRKEADVVGTRRAGRRRRYAAEGIRVFSGGQIGRRDGSALAVEADPHQPAVTPAGGDHGVARWGDRDMAHRLSRRDRLTERGERLVADPPERLHETPMLQRRVEDGQRRMPRDPRRRVGAHRGRRAPRQLPSGGGIVGIAREEHPDALGRATPVGGVAPEEETHVSRRGRGAR